MIDWIYVHFNETDKHVYMLGNYKDIWAYLTFPIEQPLTKELTDKTLQLSGSEMKEFLSKMISESSDENVIKFAKEAIKIIKLGGY